MRMLPESFINHLASRLVRIICASSLWALSSDLKKKSRQNINPCEARTALMIAYKLKLKAIREIRR